MSLTRVVLTSGRSIDLAELRLSSTYGGMLEGYPCRPVNDLRIKGLLRSTEDARPASPVHLVQPAREYDQYAGAFGPVGVLPSVACVGAFHSTTLGPARHDPILYRSHLTIIWFQPTPEVPSGHDADETLRDAAWEDLARDYEL